MAIGVPALGAVYTPSLADIDSMYQVTTGTLTSGPTACGDWTVTISKESGNWGDVQIGRDATIEGPGSAFYSGSWADLSGYTAYSLRIKNTSTTNDWFMANIYLNTGYTDWGEPDNYYQNDWTWLAPSQCVTLTLDLSSVERLNHVSSIGFNIGTNVGEGDYFGDDLAGCTVPEPATICLLGLGVLSLIRRKR
jgi:hypothetical protein